MAEAPRPRLVIVLETTDMQNKRIATFELASDDGINNTPSGNPNVAEAIAIINEYRAQPGENAPV